MVAIALMSDDTRPHHCPSLSTVSSINARVDRLPATRHIWALVALISFGGWFEFYDLIFTGYIAPGLTKSGLLETTTSQFFGLKGIAGFIAATFSGLFIGTFGFGFLSDKHGRRRVFIASLLWYSVSSIVMAFQQTAEGLLAWRFISGIGLGVQIVTISAYIIELVPAALRGRAIAFNQSIMFTAAPVSALLSSWLVPQTLLGIEGWRWVVLIGAVGASIGWLALLRLPESPRWLARNGQLDKADAALAHIEARVLTQYGQPLPAPAAPVTPPSKAPSQGFSALFTRPFVGHVLMLLSYNFCQALAFYGFNNWVPTLLIAKGILVTKSLYYAAVIAITFPLGPLLAMYVADKVERKWLISVCCVLIAGFGLIFSQMTEPAWLVAIGVLMNLTSNLLSPCSHTYQSELFPTQVRTRAAGFVYSFSRLGAMLSGFVIAYCLRAYGVHGVFELITALMVFNAFIVGFFGPKTREVALDQMGRSNALPTGKAA